MQRPFPIFSQSDYLIQIVDINSHTWWQTVQIQISWLLQKPTDLDLHCFQRQGISGFSRTRVNPLYTEYSPTLYIGSPVSVLGMSCYILASVAQSDARPTWDQEVTGSTPAESATFFCGDWSWNIFYGHSLPSTDSRRAVVSFWQKNVHITG